MRNVIDRIRSHLTTPVISIEAEGEIFGRLVVAGLTVPAWALYLAGVAVVAVVASV